jgi:hypothetical protein
MLVTLSTHLSAKRMCSADQCGSEREDRGKGFSFRIAGRFLRECFLRVQTSQVLQRMWLSLPKLPRSAQMRGFRQANGPNCITNVCCQVGCLRRVAPVFGTWLPTRE